MNTIKIIFKDARNPANLVTNTKGMSELLTSLFQKAGLSGNFSVMLVTMMPGTMKEKGVKITGCEKRCLRIKLLADGSPFDANLFFSSYSTDEAYRKLSAVMDSKHFAGTRELEGSVPINPITVPEISSREAPALNSRADAGNLFAGSDEDKTIPARKFSLRSFADDADQQVFLVEELRRNIPADRTVSTGAIKAAISSLYNVPEIPSHVLAPLVRIIKRKGYIEPTGQYIYRLTVVADQLLLRKGLINEAEAIRSLPPLTVSEKPLARRSDIVQPPKNSERLQGAFGERLGKLEKIGGELKSLESALESCETHLSELREKKAAIEREMTEAEAAAEKFRSTLKESKFVSYKQAISALDAL